MSAFTPVIRDGGEFGWEITARERGQVPVVRNYQLYGVVAGIDGPGGTPVPTAGNHPAVPGDAWIRSQVAAALREESWLGTELIGISVTDGVVHLSGEIDSLHGDLAVCRIAAMTPGTKAIVDDLFIPCE